MLSCGMAKSSDPIVMKLRAEHGDNAGLADKLTKLNPTNPISRQAIAQWRRVPAERVLDVERVTGVRREVLRPDLAQIFAGAA